jgi:tetratricopeptide (TPR) repeat protein
MRHLLTIILLVFILFSCGKNARDRNVIPTNAATPEDKKNIEALNVLSEAIKQSPSVSENYYKRALLNNKMGETQNAFDDIERADKLKPNTSKYFYLKAFLMNELNMPDALQVAQNAEALNYDKPDLYNLLADLYMKKNDLAMARKYLSLAYKLYPLSGENIYLKGVYSLKTGDTLSGLYKLHQAAKVKPNYFRPYDHLIKIYNSKRNIDSALKVNEIAIKRFPKKTEMVFNKAQILENVGALDSSRKVYQQFMKLEPKRIDTYNYIGNIFLKQKDYANAFKNYEKVLIALPKTNNTYYLAALCQEKLNNFEKAKEYYSIAAEKNPNDIKMSNAVARMDYFIDRANYTEIAPTQKLEFKYKAPEKSEEVIVEEERRAFKESIGNIEMIQKKKTVKIGIDSTRN